MATAIHTPLLYGLLHGMKVEILNSEEQTEHPQLTRALTLHKELCIYLHQGRGSSHCSEWEAEGNQHEARDAAWKHYRLHENRLAYWFWCFTNWHRNLQECNLKLWIYTTVKPSFATELTWLQPNLEMVPWLHDRSKEAICFAFLEVKLNASFHTEGWKPVWNIGPGYQVTEWLWSEGMGACPAL